MTRGMLTLDEAAEWCAVSARDILREIAAGRLPAMRIGRRYRIRKSDFEAWLDRSISAHTRTMAEPRLIPITDGRRRRA